MPISDISTYLGNKIIDHIFRNQAYTPAATVYVSAHTSDPGLTGANEVGTAGSNGYSRQALTLGAGSSKASASSAQVQITMPSTLASNTIVSWLGIWDAATGGNFLMRVPLLGTNLEATVTASTDTFVTGETHGFSAGDRVAVYDGGSAGTVPSGITEGTLYYVGDAGHGLTTTAFKLYTDAAYTTVVDVAADGGVIVRKLTAQPFNASNILQVASGALTIGF